MKVNRNSLTVLAVLASLFGFASHGVADVWLGDFETVSLDGWNTDGTFGTAPTLSQSTIGVTYGSFSLASLSAQGQFWGPATGNLIPSHASDLINSTRLSLDLTLNGTALNGGSGSFSGYAQSNELAITLYASSSFNIWMQMGFAAAGVSDSSGQSATWSGVDGTRTIVWDLTKFTATDPTTSTTKTLSQLLADHPEIVDSKIGFVEQMGGGANPGTFYFDNVKLNAVPEPASMAALGIGALALIRRRRNRK